MLLREHMLQGVATLVEQRLNFSAGSNGGGWTSQTAVLDNSALQQACLLYHVRVDETQ